MEAIPSLRSCPRHCYCEWRKIDEWLGEGILVKATYVAKNKERKENCYLSFNFPLCQNEFSRCAEENFAHVKCRLAPLPVNDTIYGHFMGFLKAK